MKRKKMTVSIITLFPEFAAHYAKDFGIIARAIKNKAVVLKTIYLRNFGLDARKTVDDRPYGGGVGMVLRADVLLKAIQSVRKVKVESRKVKVILLTPQGKPFQQKDAKRLSKYTHLIFIAGRYEGFDERVRSMVDEELSIGDYVLMGGELPALVITEAVIRLIPGVLGKSESADNESFSENLLEYPQYTKPELLTVNSKQLTVPKVLLSGHHANIEAWRHSEAVKRTKKRRPDLIN